MNAIMVQKKLEVDLGRALTCRGPNKCDPELTPNAQTERREGKEIERGSDVRFEVVRCKRLF